MSSIRLRSLLSLGLVFPSWFLPGQTPSPSTGEITVQLVQGLDSATNPRGVSQGRVTKSTSPSVPTGTLAMLGLGADPVNGGYTVKLLRLNLNGQMVPAASSAVVMAPDIFNKMQEKTRAKGQPQDAASGTRVFLPERMIVRFTLTAPPPEAAAVKNTPPNAAEAKPKAWMVDTVGETADSGAEVTQRGALLEGTVVYRNTTARAYLVMHCDFPTKKYPTLLPLETILGVNPELLTAPGAPGAPVDLSEVATSRLGSAPAIHTNAIGQNRSTGGRVLYFYDFADIQAIVNAGEQTLRLALGSDESPDTIAQFSLPSDNAPVKGIMSACLERRAAAAQAIQDKMVASCPSRSGYFLYNVELKYSDGKPVAFDGDEMDNGGEWKIPAPVKGRLARSLSMACTYRKDDSEEGSHSPEARETVPVPVSARSCSFKVAAANSRNSASCLSITASAAEALNSSNSIGGRSQAGQPASAGRPNSPGSNASDSASTLPAGPVGPVNRLNVRGISVRMGRGQILAAAKTAGMVITSNTSDGLKIVDPAVLAASGPRSGLFLTIVLKNDTAVRIIAGEQGAANGEIFEDLSKKWGKPASLPYGWNNQLGAPGEKAFWGDKKSIYAEYDPSVSSFTGQTVIISDAVALAPHIQPRKSVPM